MVAAGLAVMWLGYQQVIYGYVLLKGYNIRWRDLANPLNPYQWPAKGQNPPLVPAGQVLPSGSSSSISGGGKPKTAAAAA